MTVGQLMKELQKYPPDAEVTISATMSEVERDCGFDEAGGNITRITTYINPLTGKIVEVELDHHEEE